MNSKLKNFLALTLATLSICANSQAQEGTVHGAFITAKTGGGCFYTATNLPIANPFQDPGYSNAIYCKESFFNSITFQGKAAVNLPVAGTAIPSPTQTQYDDNLGALYTDVATDSQIKYCEGSSCYAAAPGDSAYRTTSAAISQQNIVKAINGKNDPSDNIALRLASIGVVDGKAIGFTIEGGKSVVEIGKDELRVVEIFPTSPDFDNEAELTNPKLNPYTVAWVNPDKTSTPHKEKVDGIGFVSNFDGGRWKYFLVVNGKTLPSIGKYLVNFSITKNIPIDVAFKYKDNVDSIRFCGATGICRSNRSMSLTATLTVSYGTEQCIKQAGIPLPSIIPLLNVHKQMIDGMNKDYKPAFRKLNGLIKTYGRLVTVRLRARKLRNTIDRAMAFNAEARVFEGERLKSLTELYTATELGLAAKDLLIKGQVVVKSKTPERVAVKPMTREFIKVLGSYISNNKPGEGPQAGTAAERKKAKEYQKYVNQADIEYNKFSQAMTEALEKDAELRQNSYQCGAVF